MNTNELSLIQELSRNPSRTQRELSDSTGLSLGMTNILLKRLIRKGYLKVRQLNWNKTQYLLTLKGAAEKTRKSCFYAAFVWRQAARVSAAIQRTVRAEYDRGIRDAAVVAWPETADLIRSAVAEAELPGLRLRYVESFKQVRGRPEAVFAATVEPRPARNTQRIVPLLDQIDLEFRFEP